MSDRPLTFDTYRDTENGDTAETIRYLRERVRALVQRNRELEAENQRIQRERQALRTSAGILDFIRSNQNEHAIN